MELTNKQLKRILFLLIIVFQVVLFSTMIYNEVFVNSKEESYNRIEGMLKEQGFKGVIKEKTRDRYNHNNALIVLKNGRKIVLFEQIYSQLEKDDSIIKKQNELQIEVYRSGVKKIVDLNSVLEYYK